MRERARDALLVVVLVALAGCGLSPQQSPTPSPSWTDVQLPTLEVEP